MKHELARLSKHTLVYGIGGVLNRLIGFFLLPVFTAYLAPADYGLYAMLGLVAFVATSVFSLGLGAGVGPCYFEGNRPDQKERTIWTTFLLLMLSATCVVGVGCWLAPEISALALQTPAHGYLVRLTIVGVALNILMIPLTLRLQFEERATTFVVLTVISTPLTIGISLWMVVGLGRGIRGLVEAGLIGQALSLMLIFIPVAATTRLRVDWRLAGELLRLSLPLVPSFAFLFVLQHGNKYLLQWMAGLDVVGVYSIGFNFGMVLNLVVSAFQTAWYPYFMSFLDRQEEASRVFGRIVTYYLLGCGGLCILFFVTARPIVTLMTQPAFHQAYLVVGLSATAQCLIGVFSLLLPGIYFAKDMKCVSLIQAIAMIVSLVMNFILIRSLGILGAALGLVVGMLILVILQYGWNRWRGYLAIQFDWSRIRRFSLLLTSYAVLTLGSGGLQTKQLFMVLGVLTLLLPGWFYFLLRSGERAFLRDAVAPLFRGAPSRLSLKV